jgi:multiple sugar transport system permease protein
MVPMRASAVSWRGVRFRTTLSHVLVYTVLSIVGLTMAFPFYYMVITSLKQPGTELLYPPQWIPIPVWFANYPRVFTFVPFMLYVRNTVFITAVATVGTMLSASMAAFAFARLPFRGRTLLFWLTIATMMIPGQVTLIPTFLGFRLLNWIGTFLPLILPPFFGGGAFNIFLLRQFFTTIPQDLIDAAEIDGATPWRVFWTLFLPLCKPALATLTVLTILGRWNDLFGPLIFLRRREMYTIAVGLALLNANQWYMNGAIPVLMAASVISLLPMLILFIFAQQYFVQGIVTTGLKG